MRRIFTDPMLPMILVYAFIEFDYIYPTRFEFLIFTLHFSLQALILSAKYFIDTFIKKTLMPQIQQLQQQQMVQTFAKEPNRQSLSYISPIHIIFRFESMISQLRMKVVKAIYLLQTLGLCCKIVMFSQLLFFSGSYYMKLTENLPHIGYLRMGHKEGNVTTEQDLHKFWKELKQDKVDHAKKLAHLVLLVYPVLSNYLMVTAIFNKFTAQVKEMKLFSRSQILNEHAKRLEDGED